MNKLILFFVISTFPSFIFCQENKPYEISYKEAVELALKNSPELKKMNRDHYLKRMEHNIGIRDFLPSMEVSFNDLASSVVGSSDSYTKVISLGLTQPVFNGGRGIINRKLTSTNLLLSYQEIEELKEKTTNSIWEKYYKCVLSKKQFYLQKELLNLMTDQLIISETELNIGGITELEFLEIQLKKQSVELELKQAEFELEQSLNELRNLMGMHNQIIISLKDEFDNTYEGLKLEIDSGVLYTIAEQSNLQLQKAYFKLEQSKIQYNMARLSFLPMISVKAVFNITGDRYPLQDGGFSLSINISFPDKFWPMEGSFSFGKTNKDEMNHAVTLKTNPVNDLRPLLNPKAAKFAAMNTQEELEQLRKNINIQLEQQIEKYRYSQNILDLKKAQLSLQEKKVNIMRTQHNLGELKRLDLIEAEIEFYNQSLSIQEDIYGLIQQERSIERILGMEVGSLESLTK